MRKKNHKMDVYNELKLSVLNNNKKMKSKLEDTTHEIDQMAYAPHHYNFGTKTEISSQRPQTLTLKSLSRGLSTSQIG